MCIHPQIAEENKTGRFIAKFANINKNWDIWLAELPSHDHFMRSLKIAPSFDETAGICAIVAVVDTRRVLVRARETTARGV
jgi:hypothetical protein